jgi:hypothetical protein
MTDIPEQVPRRVTAIRKMGESDINAETKHARNHVVDETEKLLHEIARKQAAGEMLEVNNLLFPIETEPKIRHTNLGRTAIGLPSVGVEKKPGASLYGDGETSPYTFELVTVDKDGLPISYQLTGTDPLLIRREDGSIDYQASERISGTGNAVATSLKIARTIRSEDKLEDSETKLFVDKDGRVGKSLFGNIALQDTSPPVFTSFDDQQRHRAETMQTCIQDLRSVIGLGM